MAKIRGKRAISWKEAKGAGRGKGKAANAARIIAANEQRQLTHTGNLEAKASQIAI